jgi:predicted acetyltransferase
VTFEIRPIVAHETATFLEVLDAATGLRAEPQPGHDEPPDPEERFVYTLDRTLAAFDGDVLVGATASELLELTVSGERVVDASKITLTGVLPTHRARGIAGSLMRRQLADLRGRREPIAILTAAQSHVPDSHGFHPATRALSIEAAPGRMPAHGDAGGLHLRLVSDRAEARNMLPAVYDRHRRGQVGQVSRPPAFWTEWFRDRPRLRIGPSERFVVVAETADGECHGYLTYRLRYGPLREEPVSDLIMEDLIALTDEARAALWRYALSFTQASRLRAWNLPVDDPVQWLPSNPAAVRVTGLRGFLRLRIVDVAAALERRRYRSGELVLEVTDDVLADNAGRFALLGDDDEAACTRTGRAPDLRLSIADLAAAYLGDVAFGSLARAGRVGELAPGAVERADAMFGGGPTPWTVTDW